MTAVTLVAVCLTAAVAAGASSDEPPRTLFLNRCVGGCTIEPGADDARTNHSSLVDGTSIVSEWAHSDED